MSLVVWSDSCFIAAPWYLPTTYGPELRLSPGNGGILDSAVWGKIPGAGRPAIRQNGGAGSEPDVAVAGLDQSALIGERDRLGAVVEPEFGENARDV